MDALVNPRIHEPVVIPYDDREQWLALREKTIGASESAALFTSVADNFNLTEEFSEDGEFLDEEGEPASPYSTPLSLYALKKGLISVDRDKPNERIVWGQKFEPIIAQTIAERQGWGIRRPAGMFVHPRIERMSATLDFEIDTNGIGEWIPFEIKQVAAEERWKWKNALGEWTVPEHIMIQVQHQMSVAGTLRAVVGVLFGGNDPRFFPIDRDEDLIADIEGAVCDFIKCLDEDREPEPDYVRDGKVLRNIRLKIDPDLILDWTVDASKQQKAAEIKFHSAQKTQHEKEADRLRAELLDELGTAAGADLGDLLVSSSVVEGGAVSYTRSSYRRVGFKKPPKKHVGNKLSASKKQK